MENLDSIKIVNMVKLTMAKLYTIKLAVLAWLPASRLRGKNESLNVSLFERSLQKASAVGQGIIQRLGWASKGHIIMQFSTGGEWVQSSTPGQLGKKRCRTYLRGISPEEEEAGVFILHVSSVIGTLSPSTSSRACPGWEEAQVGSCRSSHSEATPHSCVLEDECQRGMGGPPLVPTVYVYWLKTIGRTTFWQNLGPQNLHHRKLVDIIAIKVNSLVRG